MSRPMRLCLTPSALLRWVAHRGLGLLVSLVLLSEPVSMAPAWALMRSAQEGVGASSAAQKEVRELVPDKPIERELAGGEIHAYRVTLVSGQYLRVVVEQRGIDVVVGLFGPDGQPLTEMDSPNGTEGPEPVSVVAEMSGMYRLEVRSLEKDAPPGRYEVGIEELREASQQDRSRIAAQKAFVEGVQLYAQGTAESLQQAIGKYEKALRLWRAVGDRQGEAQTLQNLGIVSALLGQNQEALDHFSQTAHLWRDLGNRQGEAETLNSIGVCYSDLGDNQKALEYYSQALLLRQAMGDRRGEAETLYNVGAAYWLLGENQKALENYHQALPLLQDTGDRRGQAYTLNSIGLVYASLGETQRALDSLSQALLHWRATENRRGEITTLHSIGTLYSSLGEAQRALEYYDRALRLERAIGDRYGEANTLYGIGATYWSLGEAPKTLEYYNQALPLLRAVGDRRGEADTLTGLGVCYNSLGEHQKALEYYDQALQLRRAVGDRRGEAITLHNTGSVYASLRENRRALEYYGQALQLSQAVGDHTGEAAIRYSLARAERDRGTLAEARTHIEASLKITESLRTSIASPELRASYLASTRNNYEFYTDLLIRLHQHQPSAGYNATALQASERARARSLLEILSEAQADIRQGVDPTLLDRERALQQQLNAKEQYRMKLLSGKHTEEQAAAAEKEVRDLLTQYQEVQAKIRASSPRYAALTQPQPLSLKEIQQQVLDDDTLLLEYALGEERSFLWAVTPTSISSFELPKRTEIETAARHVCDLLKAEADADFPDALTALSQVLLGPVAEQ